MAIAPISVGDKSARAKMNEVIAKANLVDGKATVAQVSAETAARHAAISQEAAARGAGLSAEAAARQAGLIAEAAARRADILALPLPMPVQRRPGDAPLEFGRSLADGESAGIAPLPDAMLRYDEAGKVVRLTGDDIVAPRHLFALEPGRRYLATFAVQRRVNSPDPDNDAIRCAFAWYGQGKGRLLATPQTVAQDLVGLTTGSGRQVVRAVVSRASGADVDIVAPAGARYARPYVQTYGTLVQNDVEVIDWADITDVVAFAPDVSALEGRIAAVESIDAGDRLDVVEAAIAAPDTVRFKTLGGLVAGSVPIIVDAIEVLGYAAPGDGGGHRRRRVAGASDATVADIDGYLWEIAEPTVTPEMLGGNVQASMLAAAAIGARWKAAPKVYTVSELTVPDDLTGGMKGATIAFADAAGAASVYLSIGDRVSFDQLNLAFDGSQDGTGTLPSLVKAGDDFTCGPVWMTAPSALGYNKNLNGLLTTGVRSRIARIRTVNIDYPLSLINPSTTDLATGSVIGPIEASGYLRTMYAQFISATFGDITARGRSANASLISGSGRYISNLFEGVQDTVVGNLHLEESGHGFRVGGSPHANAKAENLTFGNIYVTKSRGCAFKVNPTREVSPGVTEKAYSIRCGNITSVDGGDGYYEGNRDFIRLSHIVGAEIGYCQALVRDQTHSHQDGVLLNDIDGLRIASVHGDNFNTAFVNLSGTSDTVPGEVFGGDIHDVVIGRLSGRCSGSNAVAVDNAFNYGDISIGLDGISGFTRLFAWFTTGTLDGDFRLHGWVGGVVLPVYLNAPVDARFRADVEWSGLRGIGRASSLAHRASFEVGGSPMSLDDSPGPGEFGGLFITNFDGVAGNAAIGGTIMFGRPGAIYRSAAVGAMQFGANPADIGLAFWTSATASSSHKLALSAALRVDGNFELTRNNKGTIMQSPDGTRYLVRVANGGTLSVSAAPT